MFMRGRYTALRRAGQFGASIAIGGAMLVALPGAEAKAGKNKDLHAILQAQQKALKQLQQAQQAQQKAQKATNQQQSQQAAQQALQQAAQQSNKKTNKSTGHKTTQQTTQKSSGSQQQSGQKSNASSQQAAKTQTTQQGKSTSTSQKSTSQKSTSQSSTSQSSTTLTQLPSQTSASTTVAAAVATTTQSSTTQSNTTQEKETSSDQSGTLMKVGGPVDQKDTAAQAKTSEETAKSNGAEDKSKGRGSSVSAAALAPVLGTFSAKVLLGKDLDAGTVEKLRDRGYKPVEGYSADVTRLTLPDYADVPAVLDKLRADFPGEAFGLNFMYQLYRTSREDLVPYGDARATTEGGCHPSRCYGHSLIGWEKEHAACARGVRVGIVDTGVDLQHTALARSPGKQLTLYRQSSDSARKAPDWHGTGVAALLAGAPSSGTPGLVPEASFAVADVFFKNRDGQTETDTEHLIWALRELEGWQAQVINMSLVGPRDDLIHARIIAMARKGVVFVAAAGNGGPGAPPAYPAAYKKEVIAVTAVDRNVRSYAEANYGDYIDVAAPGVRIWTALPGNREGALSGTSFAVPFVTAVVASIYKSSGLDAPAGARRAALDPKKAVLARLATTKIGKGDAIDREIFGLGMVKAPANCAPPERNWAPSVQRTPDDRPAFAAQHAPAAEDKWLARVRRTASSP